MQMLLNHVEEINGQMDVAIEGIQVTRQAMLQTSWPLTWLAKNA